MCETNQIHFSAVCVHSLWGPSCQLEKWEPEEKTGVGNVCYWEWWRLILRAQLKWHDRQRRGERDVFWQVFVLFTQMTYRTFHMAEFADWTQCIFTLHTSTNFGTVHSILVRSLPRGPFYCNKMLLFHSSVYVKSHKCSFLWYKWW